MPIYVIDKIKQKNNGTFALMDATDVVMKNGKNVETVINEIEIGVGDGIKTANDLLVLLETDNTGRMIVDLNETGDKVEIHLDNTFVDTLLTTSKLGQANGVASLDSEGKIPSEYLPGSVDEILEYDKLSAFPTKGEASKIYVAKDTNLVYRWGGSSYVEISASLALGETSTTAYAGDKGKQNALDISTLRNTKQDKLIAGANIEIQGTTISSKLTPATANVIGGIKVGDGLKIDSTGLLSVNFATTEEVQALFNAVTPPVDELIGYWRFNDSINVSDNKLYNVKFDVNFFSNTVHFTYFRIYETLGSGEAPCLYYENEYAYVNGYDIDVTSGWQNNEYKIINITDTSNLTNREKFTAWLKANATKQGGIAQGDSENAGGSTVSMFKIHPTIFGNDIKTYQFEEGMTWEQWINSKYNINKEFTNEITKHHMERNGGFLTNARDDMRLQKKSNENTLIFVTLADYIILNEEYLPICYGGSNAGGGTTGKA